MDIDEIPDDPYALFARWYSDAEQSEPRVPDAMQLVTVGEGGAPSVRTVLLKGVGPEGLVFFTNYGSRKARQLDADARVALCFHWKTLERQVLVEGTAERLSDADSDLYFSRRPRGSQVGAWASKQSEPLSSRARLEGRVAQFEERFRGQPVPRPEFWGGYRIHPHRFEFWQGREDRLHDRIELVREGEVWVAGRLYP